MTVSVVGLGFVGLTTALGFAEYGHTVYGLEADEKRLEQIRTGNLPFHEPDLGEVLQRHLQARFFPTSHWEKAVAESDIIFYCVGTPYGEGGEADLTFLFQAIRQTLDAIHDQRFRVLVIKSTVPPSTTKERVIPYIEQYRKSAQLAVTNNPEFLREGHCWQDFIHADRIVLGVEDSHAELVLLRLYEKANVPVCVVPLNTSEFIKYLSNSVLACLISFSNEMSLAADAIGEIDIAKAFRILHMDRRWQTGSIRDYFYPGCGYGGYCLPKDTSAFYALARAKGYDCRILRSVINTNEAMPAAAAKKIIRAAGRDKSACIGILGLSFNAGSSDVRDTPSAKVISGLCGHGYHNFLAYDPVAVEEFQAHYNLPCKYAASYAQVLEEAHLLVILTAWPEFREIRKQTMKKIVDCRYMLSGIQVGETNADIPCSADVVSNAISAIHANCAGKPFV